MTIILQEFFRLRSFRSYVFYGKKVGIIIKVVRGIGFRDFREGDMESGIFKQPVSYLGPKM